MLTVRQRAYARGWIRDRYFPAPIAFGLDRVTFALARPGLDRARGLVERWRSRKENVLLWVSDEGLFGVFLSSGPIDMAGLGGTEESAAVETLEVPSRRDSVPTYFDFELAWARATGLPGVAARYPRPLPEPLARSGDDGAVLPSPVQRARVLELVTSSQRSTGAPPRLDLFGQRIRERALESGWVGYRSLLHPAVLASAVTGFPAWASFVRGTLLSTVRPPQLFQALVGRIAVSPFLFATDGRRVLFAVLSTGPGTRRTLPRSPVLPTLQEHLEDIAVSQWPLGTTRVIADHTYDWALAGANGKRG